jgi:hypothetical protein
MYVRRGVFLVLDILLHVFNRFGRFHVQGDGLARESLDENLFCC